MVEEHISSCSKNCKRRRLQEHDDNLEASNPQPTQRLLCPFARLHTCRGKDLALSSLHSHLRRVHFSNEARVQDVKNALLYVAVYEKLNRALHAVKKWLCGCCFQILPWSRHCLHKDADGRNVFVSLTKNADQRIPASLIQCLPPATIQSDVEFPYATPARLVEPPPLPTEPISLSPEILERVFRLSVPTVKSIPLLCRLPFADTLRAALLAVATSPDSIEAWVRLLLLPSCVLFRFMPHNAAERKAKTRASLQQQMILQSLEVWNSRPNGIQQLLIRVFGYADKRRPNQIPSTNVQRAKYKVMDGQYAAALKMLMSNGVAPPSPDTFQALLDKHPQSTLPPSTPDFGFQHALEATPNALEEAIKSFPKGTACATDGLRAQHLLDSMCGAAVAVKADLLKTMTTVVNLWLRGKCPLVLAPYIASAPLTPLLKRDAGIRPIAVGLIWRRLVSKIAMKGVLKEAHLYLMDHQFGVGVRGGAEAIVHATNRLLEAEEHNTSMSMALIDFTNAFNLVNRAVMFHEVHRICPSIARWVEFTYGSPSQLYLGKHVIFSSTGVQQGDPLGPLLFSLAVHPLIQKLQSDCRLDLNSWYLDDGTLIGETDEVAKALTIIQDDGPTYGLFLNIPKTQLFWPTHDAQRLSPTSVFPTGIARPMRGVNLLGAPVTTDVSFAAELLQSRIDKILRIMETLAQLDDTQSELLLLRACVGMPRLNFALRTCPPHLISSEISLFDRGLRKTLQRIVVGEGPGFGEFQWQLAILPMRLGGLGIYSATHVASFAYWASALQTLALQNTMLYRCPNTPTTHAVSSSLHALEVRLPSFDFQQFDSVSAPKHIQSLVADAYYDSVMHQLKDGDLSARQRSVLSCLQAAHAQDFLLTVPIQGLGLSMSSVEYRAILRYRLQIPLYPGYEQCPLCQTAPLDALGDHAAHCATRPGYKFRHDHVRDALFSIISRAGIKAMKEAPVGFLADHSHIQRPADILLFDWNEGKHACVDLTGVSPLVARTCLPLPGQVASDAAEAKVKKHKAPCEMNNHIFIPFAFDTFGFLASDAVALLCRIQHVLQRNMALRVSTSSHYVFRTVGFAIQKALATQFVARMSERCFI